MLPPLEALPNFSHSFLCTPTGLCGTLGYSTYHLVLYIFAHILVAIPGMRLLEDEDLFFVCLFHPLSHYQPMPITGPGIY